MEASKTAPRERGWPRCLLWHKASSFSHHHHHHPSASATFLGTTRDPPVGWGWCTIWFEDFWASLAARQPGLGLFALARLYPKVISQGLASRARGRDQMAGAGWRKRQNGSFRQGPSRTAMQQSLTCVVCLGAWLDDPLLDQGLLIRSRACILLISTACVRR